MCEKDSADTRFIIEPVAIDTPRLHLRAFREADAQDVFEACKNPVLGRNAGWPPHESIQDSLDYITAIVPMGCVWAVTERSQDASPSCAEGPVIGSIGFRDDPRFPDEPGTLMLGYWLAEEKWGCGYTAEAARAIIDWAFAQPGVMRITACHNLDNDASRRVLEKCGFKNLGQGVFASDYPDEGEVEVLWYELTR